MFYQNKDGKERTKHTGQFLPNVEMLLSTDYNAKIYSGHFSDQTVKNNITSYENIEKIAPVYDN